MALTITINGKGVIANADSLTADTGGAGTGTWHELGGGSISINPDVYLYGSSSIGSKYASKSGWTYFDEKTGLDFTAGTGTEDGQFIYMWVNISAGGALDTLANKGLAIRIGSSTTDYREYVIAGSNDTNGWSGGWKLFVIDPTFSGTVADTGTFDISSVQFFGLWIDTATSVRADSIWIDQIAVGDGIKLYGSSTSGWKDVVNYCTDYTNRAWGMFQEREGIYYSYGKTYIGYSTQSANTSFVDSNKTIQYGESQYWSGSAWISSFPTDGSGIIIDDSGSFSTIFEDGVIVGTDQGRSGSSLIGNEDQDVLFDASGLTHANSRIKCYNTQFKNLYGGIKYHDEAASLFYGGLISSCGVFEPVGDAILRNLIISGYSGTLGAVLWNENIDLQKTAFIANTDITNNPAAIEHPSAAGTPYNYYDLTFSANDFDGINTSGTNITVNNNGTSDAANDTGANTITYLSSATLSMTVKDINGTEVASAYAYIDDNNTTPFIMNTLTNASGIASVGHTAGAITGATWRIRKYGYKPYVAVVDIPASGLLNIPVTLIIDPQQQ